MSLSSIPDSLREAVHDRDKRRCRYCRLAQFGQGAIFHIDHIVPRSKGGATTIENLATQCPHCSLRKSMKIDGTDPETGAIVPLFHPLTQNWSEHFELIADGVCRGLTPVGRATVIALSMNDDLPRTARMLQQALGIVGGDV